MMTTPRVLSSRLKNLSITGYLPCTDRKSTRLNSSHTVISYAVFCLKKKNNQEIDFEFIAIKLLQESVLLPKISEIDFSNVNKKSRVLLVQLISQHNKPYITQTEHAH